jgi:hypothetical protein
VRCPLTPASCLGPRSPRRGFFHREVARLFLLPRICPWTAILPANHRAASTGESGSAGRVHGCTAAFRTPAVLYAWHLLNMLEVARVSYQVRLNQFVELVGTFLLAPQFHIASRR